MRSLSESIVAEGVVAPSSSRVAAWPAVASLVACLACLFALKSVDYSTSYIVRGDEAAALLAPKTTAELGPLHWDLELYRTHPALQPFRDAFSRCLFERGIPAARCVTKVLAAHSPNGETRSEFVDAQFRPAVALERHLSGEPGNCTGRSAMAATGLLSLGTPARIAQMLPPEGRGHTVIEVFDEKEGWVLFDPLHDSSYLSDGHFASALSVSHASGGLSFRRPHEGQPNPNVFAGSTIQYPEPWLYTRVGERCALWPFRGCFAQVGPTQFRYGPVQRLVFFSILGTALFSLLWFGRLALDRRQAARS